MKYIRVIRKREKERGEKKKMLISKKVFDERGKIIVLWLFQNSPLEISLLNSSNLSLPSFLSLRVKHWVKESRMEERHLSRSHNSFFYSKGRFILTCTNLHISFPINSRGMPPSILAIMTLTQNLPLRVKHYSCCNVQRGEVSQSKRSESACIHFCQHRKFSLGQLSLRLIFAWSFTEVVIFVFLPTWISAATVILLVIFKFMHIRNISTKRYTFLHFLLFSRTSL